VPGLESRSVVVEADVERGSCGAVSDLGGVVVRAARPSRSSRTSSEDVAAGWRPIEEARESARGARRELLVRRDVRLSGDDDCDSCTSTGPASRLPLSA